VVDEILGGMPLTFLHQSGGPGVELDIRCRGGTGGG
jgi:hypothetical protein